MVQTFSCYQFITYLLIISSSLYFQQDIIFESCQVFVNPYEEAAEQVYFIFTL